MNNSFIVLDPTAPEKREIVYHKTHPPPTFSKNAANNTNNNNNNNVSEGDNSIQRRGLLFLGLKDLINQVTQGDFIKSAHFSGYESDKYKVVYSFQISGLICVLATQMVDIPSIALHTLLENTLSIIPFIWEDTNVIKERTVNDELDRIVLNMMETLSNPEKRFLNALGDTSIPFLCVEENNSLLISDLLSSIEAYLPSYWIPTYTLIHTHTVYSTIFYLNNMIVHSHMEKNDSVLVTRLCELRGYLSRTKDHPEFLTWETVYRNTDTSEKRQQFTLLVVCQEEFVLAALLQPFFSNDNNKNNNNNPSPLLVDRLRISFNKLRASGIISHIREKASQHMSPIALISEKNVFKGPSPFMILSGQDGRNILFEYVCYNRLSGAILTPNKLKQDDQQVDLIHLKFYNTILTLQSILHSKHFQKQGIEEYAVRLQPPSPTSSASNFPNIFSLASTNNNNTTTLQLNKGFWVVGRIYQNNEFYVCYQDDVPRDTLEMAFRLLFL